MFPIPDFFTRHGTPVEQIDETILSRYFRGLLTKPVGTGAKIYSANPPDVENAFFEIAQAGEGNRGLWQSSLVILPDAFTAILLETAESRSDPGVVTICVDSIVSARYVPGQVARSATHLNDDS
jgi:hypothetical protein